MIHDTVHAKFARGLSNTVTDKGGGIRVRGGGQFFDFNKLIL